MSVRNEIAVGMPVVGIDDRPVGVVEAVDGDALRVGTHRVPRAAIERVERGVVRLRLAASALAARPTSRDAAAVAGNAAGEQVTVPIVEERLTANTRVVDQGAVEIRKRVVEEAVMQPVTLRREVVEVVQRDAEGREIGVQELDLPGTSPPQP